MRCMDFQSPPTARHKLSMRTVGFRRKDRAGHKTHRKLCSAVLEMTNCERIKTTNLRVTGDLVRQDETRLPKRIVSGRLAAQWPMEAHQPSKHYEKRLQENVRALGAVPRRGERRNWFG